MTTDYRRLRLILQAINLAFEDVFANDGQLPEGFTSIEKLVRTFATRTVPDLTDTEIRQIIEAPLANILPPAVRKT
jgi:hypothetical protein